MFGGCYVLFMISVFVDVTVDVDVAFIILSLSQMQSTLDIIEQS